MSIEPLLQPNDKRFVLFPIEHQDVWKAYKEHESFFWIAEEMDLVQDVVHWEERLTETERHFIKYVLAFFASSDGIVGENLAANFYKEVQWPEARAFYGSQLAIEGIHSEAYSLLIDTYIKSKEERTRLFEALSLIPAVKKKANWAMKWMDTQNASFAERLLAFAVVEGIFFSGSFCAIFWLKNRGLLPGLGFANELISRDEGLHTSFACLLYSKLQNKLSLDNVMKIVTEAVEIETEFVCEALPVSLIGMNANLMTQYIKFVADRLLYELGYPKQYRENNPFSFMTGIALDKKTNFFEGRNSAYSKVAVGKKHQENTFSLDADF